MNPLDSDGELDLTSEPASTRSTSDPSLREPDRSPDLFANKRLRVLFKCCRVYAPVQIPEGVRSGQFTSWRFHCPRCGQLVEIPL
jgi:hypothetical protein